jgi:branched-chain amino acid transport system ATP-binding protein
MALLEAKESGQASTYAVKRQPLLTLRGVRAGYGQIEVLHGIDLTLQAGGILAVLGPNGAGKSTLLHAITRTHPVTAGEIRLAGRRINRADPVALARRGMCLIPEGRGIFPNLTVRENLRMVTHARVGRQTVEERTFTVFPNLRDRGAQLAGTMSGGEQQMLAVARAVASEPALLLLDELSMGLAPRIVEQLYAVVSRLARDGVTILLVEQFAAAVLDIADTAAVMLGGNVVLSGKPSEIRADLGAVYLGAKSVPVSGGPHRTGPAPLPRPGVEDGSCTLVSGAGMPLDRV